MLSAAMNTSKSVEFEPKTNIRMDHQLNTLRSIFDKQDIMKIMTKIILNIIGYFINMINL